MKFEDFGFGENYENACLSKINLPEEAFNKIYTWVQEPKSMLIFVGTPGTGKTYLCAALVKRWLSQGLYPRYMKERQFFNSIRGVMNDGWDYEAEIKRLCDVNYFIMDDMGSSQLTDWQKETMFSFVDHRLNSRKPTIITSNLFMDDIQKEYSSRFVSRLKDAKNTLIELNWIDKRQQ